MKHHKYYFVLIILLNLVLSFNAVGQENKKDADKPNYILETEFVTMPDGVKLATDVYFPIDKKGTCVLIYLRAGLKVED